MCALITRTNFFRFVQDWADAKLPERGLFSCLSVIPKVLLAGAITLMDEAYFKLAVWLNDKGWFSDCKLYERARAHAVSAPCCRRILALTKVQENCQFNYCYL